MGAEGLLVRLRQTAAILPPLSSALVRLAASVLLGSCIAVGLGFLYAVQRNLDLAAYTDSRYEVRSEISLTPAEEPKAIKDFGDLTFIGAKWHATFVAASGRSADATVVMASSHSNESASYFPESARIAGPDPTVGGAWVDLSADLAQRLGVGLGDRVMMPVPDAAEGVEYRVRSIYAARLSGVQYVAIAASLPAFSAISGVDEEQYLEILTGERDAAEVARILDEPYYRVLLERGKTYPPVIESRGLLLSGADRSSSASLALVQVLAVVAVAGGLAIVFREVDVFRRRALPILRLLLNLGADLRSLLSRLAWMAGGCVAVSLAVGGWLGFLLFDKGILAPCFPPALIPLLLGSLAGAVSIAEIALVVSLKRDFRNVVKP